MKRIILCEGKTDAILISYFLEKSFGWQYLNQENMKIKLPVNAQNETFNWYNHPEKIGKELAIWGVGGIEQIPHKLSEVIHRNITESNIDNRFERIVIFFDRDQRDENECITLIENWFRQSNIDLIDEIKIGDWVDAQVELKKQLPENYLIKILSIILPPDGTGALEIFLMNCLQRQSEKDKLLVEKANEFIENIPDEPYLMKRRFRPKACLGAILSVMSPDWVFSELNDRLIRINWEEIQSVLETYKKLEDL